MVGAIVLVIVAVLAGGGGVYFWFAADGPVEAIKAMTLCLTAVTALTGALVIDGIRFYADKVTTQLGYLVKSAKMESSRSTRTASASPGGKRRYRVIGTETATGGQRELTVAAADETAALRAGEQQGLEVHQVEAVEET